MTKNIQHKFFFPHPVEKVWEYLTKQELMEQWLMKNNFKLAIGYDFQFTTKPMPQLDLDGIFHCKVLEIVPLKKLTYSWKAGPGEGKITLDSIVVWELQPKDNGTEVSLDHGGFKEANFMIFTGMNNGWLEKLHKIDKLINEEKNGTTNA